VQLEGRDAGDGALGGADLGREVRQGRQVVAEDGRLLGEPVTGQLHPVAGVAGEPDDDAFDLLDGLAGGDSHGAPWLGGAQGTCDTSPTLIMNPTELPGFVNPYGFRQELNSANG